MPLWSEVSFLPPVLPSALQAPEVSYCYTMKDDQEERGSRSALNTWSSKNAFPTGLDGSGESESGHRAFDWQHCWVTPGPTWVRMGLNLVPNGEEFLTSHYHLSLELASCFLAESMQRSGSEWPLESEVPTGGASPSQH